MKLIKYATFSLIVIVVLSGCADAHHDLNNCLHGHTCGFWHGLWHGMIAPFAWIGSWFNKDIAVWSVNNNGGWYTFGFLLGIGALTSSSSSVSSKR